MDVYQHTLFTAEFRVRERDAWERAIRVVGGALVFAKLGREAQVQSMYRDLAVIRAAVQEFNVAQGKQPKRETKSQNIHWVNYKLSDEDKTQFALWQPEDDDVAAAIVQMVDGGYRFTLGYDKFKSSMSVTCIAPAEDSPNAGKGFSTFARSWEKVWALVAFKHYTLFQQTWPEPAAPAMNEDFG